MLNAMVSWAVSRHPEWDLMYSAGLTAREISDLCHANLATVHLHLKNREKYEPTFRDKHLEALRSRHADRPSTQWRNRRYQVLAFIEANGYLPSGNTRQELTLYRWLVEQRRSYSRGEMSPGKKFLLDVIPDWNLYTHEMALDQKWKNNFMKVSAYLHEFGHLPRYRNYSSTREQKLGTWLHNQHQRRSQGKLAAQRLQALDELFPGWSRKQ